MIYGVPFEFEHTILSSEIKDSEMIFKVISNVEYSQDCEGFQKERTSIVIMSSNNNVTNLIKFIAPEIYEEIENEISNRFEKLIESGDLQEAI